MPSKRGSLPLLLLVLTLFAPLAAQAMQPAGKPLLRSTSRKGTVPVKSDAKVIRRRNVLVELAPLRAKASRTTLPLFDDSVVVLVRDETEAAMGEAIVWEGEVEGQPGSMAILATVKSIVVGDVMTRSREGAFGFYQIRYLGNRVHTLMEVDQSKFPPEDEVEGRPSSRATARDVLAGVTMRRIPEGSSGSYRARYPGNGVPVLEREAESRSAPEASSGELDALVPPCEDPASRIDALVVYTDAARDAVGGKDAMTLLIESAVRSTNRSYRKSEVTQRLRLVHVQRVEYDDEGNTEVDRRRLQDTSDGPLDGVLELRDDHAADVVVLIVNRGDACGWSKVMPTVSARNESQAYAVVRQDCAGVPIWSFAHELGHIMGARHNLEDDETEGEPFPFNHGFVAKSPTAGAPWHTIMAKRLEGCREGRGAVPPEKCSTRIPWWSNPNVRYPDASGDRTGTADKDNRKALEETAPTVANFRCASR